jgi:hypothetical protein
MCITRRRYFTSFEAKLENPNPTCFVMKLPDVDACSHTIFIRSSVLKRKATNLLPLGFESQTKKSSR